MVWRATDPQGDETGKTRWRTVPYTRGEGIDVGCGRYKLWDTKHCIGVDSGKDIEAFNIEVKADVWCDATLDQFAAGTKDWVFSSHLLEHIPLDKVTDVLRAWMRVLKVGGHLVLYLPDMDQYPKCPDPELGIVLFEDMCNKDHKWNVSYELFIALMERADTAWDLVHFERCSMEQEYSLFFAFRKLKR